MRLAGAFLAVVFLAVVLRAGAFRLAVVFLAVVLRAGAFGLAVVLRAGVLGLAVDFRAVDFFAAGLLPGLRAFVAALAMSCLLSPVFVVSLIYEPQNTTSCVDTVITFFEPFRIVLS